MGDETDLTVRQILSNSAGDALEIRALIAVLEAGNGEKVVAALQEGKAGLAARVVQHSLFTRLTIWVTRAYMNSRPGDLHTQRAIYLLKDPAIRSAVEQRGSAADLRTAEKDWLRLRGDARRPKIEEYRHKELAHRGSWTTAVPKPLFGELLTFATETAKCMVDLALGARSIAHSIDDRVAEYADNATKFWEPWAG